MESITQEDYEEMRAALNDELATAEFELGQAQLDEIEVEKVLDFAENLLLNTAGVWQQSSRNRSNVCSRCFSPRGSSMKTAFIELRKLASCSRT
jgi:hypothetical protein